MHTGSFENMKCLVEQYLDPLSSMMTINVGSCDVLIKMSRVEGFFMPPCEMMACGGTVLTGKVTEYDEYVIDGYNGLVV